MFTMLKEALRLMPCCFCYQEDNCESASSDDSFLRPLLDRFPTCSPDRPIPPTRTPTTSSHAVMGSNSRKNRTYGSKKSSATSTASAIFGTAAVQSPRARSPLADLTSAISNISINEPQDESNRDNTSLTDESCSICNEIENSRLESLNEATRQLDHTAISANEDAVEESVLAPLIGAYKTDRDIDLQVLDWESVLPPQCRVLKIAEASFAEVYRVTLPNNRTSIIKIMQLQVPNDPNSLDSHSALDIQDVISEVRIMNTLYDIPGFVNFKAASLAKGKPLDKIAEAFDEYYEQNQETYFMHPNDYSQNSTFLAIELGDAGTVLEDVAITTIHEIWDILMGVTLALARVETVHEFEHRDLHENNVCIAFKTPKTTEPRTKNGNVSFGFTGIEITIIDYGLSRAKVSTGEVVCKDLELDLELFQGTDGVFQFDTYRRMRNHLFSGLRKQFPKSWHDEDSRSLSNGHNWEEFIPYTNVLWLRYLMQYLFKTYQKFGGDMKELGAWKKEMNDFSKRFDPRVKVENGAFSSAREVLEYAFEKEWIEEAVIVEYESSILSLEDSQEDQFQ